MKSNGLLIVMSAMALLFGIRQMNSHTTFYVDGKTGDDLNIGLSWTSPKATVVSALELATTGDTIKVAEGHYLVPLNAGGKIILLGGFPCGGGSRDAVKHETIFSTTREQWSRGQALLTLIKIN